MFDRMDIFPRKKRLFGPATMQDSFEDEEFKERLRKTLYYGKAPKTDRPSHALTEIAVDFLRETAPRKLGSVDLNLAADIGREACISPCSLMLGLLYVERLKKRDPDYLLHVSSSDLFLISMMLASKYLYDEGVDEEVFNEDWAEAANLDVEEVNTLERCFLQAIDWQLFVSQKDFMDLLNSIERRIARDKGKERDHYTYMDLLTLSSDEHIYQRLCELVRDICETLAVCSVTYVAGLLTVLAATTTLSYLQVALPALSSSSSSAPALLPVHHPVSLGLPTLPTSEPASCDHLPAAAHVIPPQSAKQNDSEGQVKAGQWSVSDPSETPTSPKSPGRSPGAFMDLDQNLAVHFLMAIASVVREGRADDRGELNGGTWQNDRVCTCGHRTPPDHHHHHQQENREFNGGDHGRSEPGILVDSRLRERLHPASCSAKDCTRQHSVHTRRHGSKGQPRNSFWPSDTLNTFQLDKAAINVNLGFRTTADSIVTI